MGYPLEKLFECCFFSGVVVRPPTFWEMGHFENSKRMELRKGKKNKGKEQERRDGFWKTARQKKLDTTEDPHNTHTIENQCCSWATPLVFFWGGAVF